MGKCKDLVIKIIPAQIANNFVRRVHYSGKIIPNSKIHFGVFYDDILHGVLSYGSSLDKSKIQGLVNNTGWNEFIELNRMALDDHLPKNSESRAISISIKLIKKNAPHIKWIISFADACQCGDGAIYRASGFVLTGIKKNKDLYKMPNGDVIHKMTIESAKNNKVADEYRRWSKGSTNGCAYLRSKGGVEVPGYQLRYIYFIDRDAIKDLSVPIIPFDEIKKRKISMYKGVRSIDSDATVYQREEGGAIPTRALHKLTG